MGEDRRAIAFDMLVEPNAGAGLGRDRCERGLADLKRITPQVVAIQFNEVEGVEERVAIMTSIADTVERRDAVVATNNGLSIDNA
jgi:hypothetical protein